MESMGDTIYYIWFIILIAVLAVLFVAKLKFSEMFDRRQDRRRLLAYSKARLATTNEGRARTLKIKRIKDILKP